MFRTTNNSFKDFEFLKKDTDINYNDGGGSGYCKRAKVLNYTGQKPKKKGGYNCMSFNTKVKQINSVEEFDKYLESNNRIVICAGRWGPMCIPVYKVMEQLEEEEKYKEVCFLVVNFDIYAANRIREAEVCKGFRGLPFTVYYKNADIVHATSSIQTKQQLKGNIEKHLG